MMYDSVTSADFFLNWENTRHNVKEIALPTAIVGCGLLLFFSPLPVKAVIVRLKTSNCSNIYLFIVSGEGNSEENTWNVFLSFWR